MRRRPDHAHRLSRAAAAVVAVAITAAGGPAAHAAAPRVPPAQSGAAQAARATGLVYRALSDEQSHTVRAFVVRRSSVRARPDAGAANIGALRTRTFFGTSDVVLELGEARGANGDRWMFVRYPGLGRRTGWVRKDVLGPASSVSTRVVINRHRTTVRLFKRGRLAFRARAGVGARRSPTPGGHFYIRERLVPSTKDPIYGVLAFGLSAYSRHRTDWPGGGQVGMHGTDQPELIPGHISNGCVRLRNRDIRRLDRLMPIGTPVRIV